MKSNAWIKSKASGTTQIHLVKCFATPTHLMVIMSATQALSNKNQNSFSFTEGRGVLLVFLLLPHLSQSPFCVTMNGMKAKKLWMTGLTVAGLSALALGAKKAADNHKLMKTQEELTAIVRELFSDMGEIATLYVQVYESSLERLVGGVIFEDGRHYTFVYENEDLVYEEETL